MERRHYLLLSWFQVPCQPTLSLRLLQYRYGLRARGAAAALARPVLLAQGLEQQEPGQLGQGPVQLGQGPELEPLGPELEQLELELELELGQEPEQLKLQGQEPAEPVPPVQLEPSC
jgi:hypothetical protein